MTATDTAPIVAPSTSPIAHRYEFVLLFDVTNGNPNGDPDAGNAPRLDPETGHGLVSDVCLKRKIRNYICLAKGNDEPDPGYDIYVKERAVLNQQHQRAYDALGLKPKEKPKKGEEESPQQRARRWMCQTFFDIRMFGAVMSTDINCGQVRGPVQLAFARSIDPIVSLEQSITRMAVTTEKESAAQEGGNRTMGRKEIVPYALYRAHGFISPHLAADTGFSDADLELLWQALEQMFEHDHSAARGEMSTCKLVVFEHDSALGSAPARKLFDLIQVRRTDEARPARAFSDYELTLNRDALPKGITLHERVQRHVAVEPAMPFRDDQLLPISALQHLLFCERQTALIHLERLWAENRLTVEGGQLHRKAHDGPDTSRAGVRTARGLQLASYRLGLFGVADVVELREADGEADDQPAVLPIEYKRGKPKAHDADRVQLCAQALCLEEMMGVTIAAGAIFYGRTRRREPVAFDGVLRQCTEQAAARLHELIASGITPTARREKKCDRCSLLHLCLPGALRPRRTASAYLHHVVAAALVHDENDAKDGTVV